MELGQPSYTQVPQDDFRPDEYRVKGVGASSRSYYSEDELSSPISVDPVEKDAERDAFLDEDDNFGLPIQSKARIKVSISCTSSSSSHRLCRGVQLH